MNHSNYKRTERRLDRALLAWFSVAVLIRAGFGDAIWTQIVFYGILRNSINIIRKHKRIDIIYNKG